MSHQPKRTDNGNSKDEIQGFFAVLRMTDIFCFGMTDILAL
jgi:hypothetical protein